MYHTRDFPYWTREGEVFLKEGVAQLLRRVNWNLSVPDQSTMFISTKVLVVISFFASSFAEPLAKRAYIPELKASLARIDDSWKKVENQINALPADATASDFQVTSFPNVDLSKVDLTVPSGCEISDGLTH